ncbi:MAG: response regulator [Bacteroidota bacterium]
MPIKVLIVEDEELYADQLEMLIDKLGYEHLSTVDNSKDALAAIDTVRPDLILMDVNIYGELNGIELSELIHRKFPIPIIFITSLQDDATFQQALATKPVDFLIKPFNKIQLQRSISVCVQKILADNEAANKVSSNNEASIEQLRIKISSDLHDEVGSLLSALAMQSDLLKLKGDEAGDKRIDKISEMSREAMLRMRETVWNLDDRKNTEGALLDRMRDFIPDILDTQKINVAFNTNGMENERQIPADLRKNIYLIFKEALTNVSKHSSANEVIIDIKRTNAEISLHIKDNGKMNSAAFNKSGLGLSNMHMRAQEVGGELEIEVNEGVKIIARFEV